jgi:hypothetical protein
MKKNLKYVEKFIQTKIDYTTKSKINATSIFVLKYRVCGQKFSSWIYMNSTNIDVYNQIRKFNGFLYIFYRIK